MLEEEKTFKEEITTPFFKKGRCGHCGYGLDLHTFTFRNTESMPLCQLCLSNFKERANELEEFLEEEERIQYLKDGKVKMEKKADIVIFICPICGLKTIHDWVDYYGWCKELEGEPISTPIIECCETLWDVSPLYQELKKTHEERYKRAIERKRKKEKEAKNITFFKPEEIIVDDWCKKASGFLKYRFEASEEEKKHIGENQRLLYMKHSFDRYESMEGYLGGVPDLLEPNKHGLEDIKVMYVGAQIWVRFKYYFGGSHQPSYLIPVPSKKFNIRTLRKELKKLLDKERPKTEGSFPWFCKKS